MLAPAELIPTVPEIERLLDANAGLIGVSTGYMAGARGDWSRLAAAAEVLSDDVVELSALNARELPGLAAFLNDLPELGFRRISVHGPAKGLHHPVEQLVPALAELPATVEAIVLHPDTMQDPDRFSALGERLRLENMDTRKHSARTAHELAPYFEALPAAGFCLNIAHAWLHDSSLGLAHELLDAFEDRLAEVHLSSIDDSGRHLPLRPEDAEALLPLLERCAGVPWVLEAPLPPR